jgi:hypothetical protein
MPPPAGARSTSGQVIRPRVRVTQPRCMIEDLVDACIGEASKLDFGDRPETLSSEPDRNAGDTDLGEGGVDDAIPAVQLEQAVGRTEDAAVDPDVFAARPYRRVFCCDLVLKRVWARIDAYALAWRRPWRRWDRASYGSVGCRGCS